MQFADFEKINKCLFIPIAREKSSDYVLIIYVKNVYEIAHHNYAEPKCAHQVQK